jgi:hypothetical protein
MDMNEPKRDEPEDPFARKRRRRTVVLGSAAGGLVGAIVAVSLLPLGLPTQVPPIGRPAPFPQRPTREASPEAPDADVLSRPSGGGGVAVPTPEATTTPSTQSLHGKIEALTLTMTHSTLAAIPGATAGAIVGGISAWLGNIFSSRKKRKRGRRNR